MGEQRSVRLAVAAAAGLAAGRIVPLAWAVVGVQGAVVGALGVGAGAGLIAGTRRGAVVAVTAGALPALWIDLFVVPTPPEELGGFVQSALAAGIAFLTGVALLGAAIGVAATRAEHLDLVRSGRRRMVLGVAAVGVGAGWLWLGVFVVARPPT